VPLPACAAAAAHSCGLLVRTSWKNLVMARHYRVGVVASLLLVAVARASDSTPSKGDDGADRAASSSTLPHVVFLLADDLGYADLGYRNGTDIRTPHLSSLAAEGLKLEYCYAQLVCSGYCRE
jgi:hypothetical protein